VEELEILARSLISIGLVLLLVMLRLDAEKFGTAEYYEATSDGEQPRLRRRIAWYGMGFALVVALLFIHPSPQRDLYLGSGDRLGAVLGGIAYGLLGILVAVSFATYRYHRIRFPEVWSYPGALLNSVATAFIDEATFRGAFLGMMLVAGVNPTLANFTQAILYTLTTRLGAPGRDRYLLMLTLGIGLEAARAQSVPEATEIGTLSPQVVIAKTDGQSVTVGQIMEYLQVVPEQHRPRKVSELRPFIERLGLERRLARAAVAAGLDQQAPYNAALTATRMQVLAKAQLEVLRDKMPADEAETQAWYTEHGANYTSASLQIAFIRTRPSSSGKSNGIEQGEAKAAKFAADARAGKSFEDLIDRLSDDHPLVTRNGTSKAFDAVDVLPDELKRAIIHDGKGAIVGPFAGGDGLFVCRIVDSSRHSLDSVRDKVIRDVKEAKLKDWVEKQKRSVEVREVED
jgi:hypothetical protein